jgi:ABC-2 type transport system permease protein
MDVPRRIASLILKEFTAILKDPKSRFVVIGPPIIQFFVFGYAATFDLVDVRYAVVDESRTPESRALLAGLSGSDNFELVETLSTAREIDPLINAQEIRLAVHVGPTFAEDLREGRPAPVQVILDGRNSNVASIALGYVSTIVADFNRGAGAGATVVPRPRAPAVRLVDRVWYNPNLESRWFVLSGLGGIITMVVVIILTGLSVAREREQGTFDQLLVSPYTTPEILVGKAAPALCFGMVDGLFLAGAAVVWFDVPFTGSLLALSAGLAVFMLAACGVGLFISSLSATMQQALLGAFMFIMPAVVLSGFATPISSMPQWLQAVTFINPMRYILVVLRWVFLEGGTMADVAPSFVPMALIALVTLSSAVWLFRHRTQ